MQERQLDWRTFPDIKWETLLTNTEDPSQVLTNYNQLTLGNKPIGRENIFSYRMGDQQF